MAGYSLTGLWTYGCDHIGRPCWYNRITQTLSYEPPLEYMSWPSAVNTPYGYPGGSMMNALNCMPGSGMMNTQPYGMSGPGMMGVSPYGPHGAGAMGVPNGMYSPYSNMAAWPYLNPLNNPVASPWQQAAMGPSNEYWQGNSGWGAWDMPMDHPIGKLPQAPRPGSRQKGKKLLQNAANKIEDFLKLSREYER